MMERKRLTAIVGLIFLVAFTAGWLLKGRDQTPKAPDMIIEAGPAATPISAGTQDLWVYVVGAVENPGVYQLAPDSRVFQAVEMAEPASEADLAQLDMARVLMDGEKIRVPRQGEMLVPQDSPEGGSSGLVNINKADVQELDSRLPGIGPALAQRIVDYRGQHPFAKKEDIKEVSGIGDQRYNDIKDLITVAP